MPPERKPYILIVDDEESIRSALAAFLGRAGYEVGLAQSGDEALTAVQFREPDLVLLDVVLDERDPNALSGLDVCRQLRKQPRFIPIIMLTSYPEWQVESLGQGAIAFVTKPWDNNALASQIRTTLSAINQLRQEAGTAPAANHHLLQLYPDIVIDLERLRVSRAGAQIDLTPIEFALLAHLARNINRPFSREALLNEVWDDSWAGYPRVVDRHIAAIRRKLDLPGDSLIETVHGLGYRLVQP